jgi:hypothetical protein
VIATPFLNGLHHSYSYALSWLSLIVNKNS